MEFEGRILKVLPKQEGVSEKTGNAWATQEFIFEYFEHPTDRYSDKVLLRTFDTNHMAQLVEGANVRIGFGHSVRDYTKDGKTSTFNEVRLYKFEVISKPSDAPTEQPQATNQQPQQNAPTGDANGEGGKDDDLTF